MTNNVNGIGLNPTTVGGYTGAPQGNPPAPEDTNPAGNAPSVEHTPVNPSDILNQMAMLAVAGNPVVSNPQAYNVDAYVTPEQAERIAAFMEGFEDAVAKGLVDIESEFGDLLSEDAQLWLASELAG